MSDSNMRRRGLRPATRHFVSEALESRTLLARAIDAALVPQLNQLHSQIDAYLDHAKTLADSKLATSLPVVGGELNRAAEFITSLKSTLDSNIPNTFADDQPLHDLYSAILPLLRNSPAFEDFAVETPASGAVTSVILKFDVGGVLSVSSPAFNLNLPTLGITTDGTVSLSGSYLANIDVHISSSEFYFDTSGTQASNPEISLAVTGTLSGSVSGKLGIFDLSADATGTQFSANLAADVTDQNNDGKLTITEISGGGVGLNPKISTGNANVVLSATLSVGGATTMLPHLITSFHTSWNLDNTSLTGSGQSPTSVGSVPIVSFDNVQLDLGTYFKQFVKPILDKVNVVLSPVKDIVDVLTNPIPVIDDISVARSLLDFDGDGHATLLDLAEHYTGSSLAVGLIGAVEQFFVMYDTLQPIVSYSGASPTINLGGIKLDAGNNAPDVRSAGFSLSNVQLNHLDNPGTSINAQIGSLPVQFQAYFNKQNAADGSPNPALGTSSDGGGFHFPLLESPHAAIKLLLGQTVDLFNWTTPKLHFGASTTFIPGPGIPIWPVPPIFLNLGGSIGADIQGTFGYDSAGITKYTTTLNPDDLAQGFFIATQNPDGSALCHVEFSIYAQGSVSAYVVEAGVKGGLTAGINLTVNDPDNDGRGVDHKVRFSEILTDLRLGPFNLLHASGDLSFFLGAYFMVGVGPLSFEADITLIKVKLLDFNFDAGDAESTLGYLVGDHQLILATGPYSAPRLTIDPLNPQDPGHYDFVDPAQNFEVYAFNTYTDGPNGTGNVVSQDIRVTADGHSQDFYGVKSIYAEGGNDDTGTLFPGVGDGDSIKLVGGAGFKGVQIPAEIYGDFNPNGTGNPLKPYNWTYVHHDTGNDSLYGGAGRDSGPGHNGTETLIGGGGSDHIEGSDGDVIAYLGSNNSPLGQSFKGGTGNDLVYGTSTSLFSTVADTIDAGPGNDTVLGGSSRENITGGDGNDELHGGGGNDTFLPGTGDDAIYGDAGTDQIIISGNYALITLSDSGATGEGTDFINGDIEQAALLGGNPDPPNTQHPSNNPSGANAFDVTGWNGELFIDGGDGLDTVIAQSGTGNDALSDHERNNVDVHLKIIDFDDTVLSDFVLYSYEERFQYLTRDGLPTIHMVHFETEAAIIIGAASDNVIMANLWSGTTTLMGNGGNDVLWGGNPEDVLTNGFGNVQMHFVGSGADLIIGGDGNDSLKGNGGDDFLVPDDANISGQTITPSTGAGTDLLEGDDGNDTLFASNDGHDELHGGAGNDLLNGGGDFTNGIFAPIFGGSSTVTYFGEGDSDTILGGVGHDLMWGGDGRDLLIGYSGNDTINGDDAAGFSDTIVAGRGNDVANGGAGDDVLIGDDADVAYAPGPIVGVTVQSGSGDDTLTGGPGNDWINAQDGANLVYADDTIANVTDGNDTVYTGTGKDFISAQGGADTIFSGDGDNKIFAGDGSNSVSAGTGQDIIYAGTGNDSVSSGAGDDFINAGGGSNLIDGGAGDDLLAQVLDADQVLTNSTVTGTGTSAFSSIERISLTGGPGGNLFTVSAWTGGPVLIDGGAGTNVIISSDDTDFVLGDANLTRSDATSFSLTNIQSAQLTGGANDNQFDVSNFTGTATIAGAGGVDKIIASNDTNMGLSDTGLTRSGHGSISISQISLAMLSGGSGDNSISASGFSGRVTLLGGPGDDQLYGGANDDYIDGGTGINSLTGNNGDDVLNALLSTSAMLSGGIGNDKLYGSPGADSMDGGAGNDIAYGNAGPDIIDGGGGDDTVFGGDGNDTLSGNLGSDILIGETGNDTLFAYLSTSAGDDGAVNYLYGDFATNKNEIGSGADQLFGGNGNDILFGEGGSDTITIGGSGSFVDNGPSGSPSGVAPATPELSPTGAAYSIPLARLPVGGDSLGYWTELSGSASRGGISQTTNSAIEPAMAAGAAAQFAAWADNRSGNYEIYVAEHTNGGWVELAGSAHGGGISNSTGDSRRPSISVDGSGNPIVAWTEFNGSLSNIVASRFDPSANSGVGGWVSLGSNISASGSADHAQIVNTSSGPVLSWLDLFAGIFNVYAEIFLGGIWTQLGSGSASGYGVSNSASSVTENALATDGTSVAVAWTQSTGSGNRIYLKQYTAGSWAQVDGSASGNGVSGSSGSAAMPSVAYSGSAIYVAYQNTTAGVSNIAAAKHGTGQWINISVDSPATAGNSITRGSASHPLLSSGGSSLNLVWIEDGLSESLGQDSVIYSNRLVGSSFVRNLPTDATTGGIHQTHSSITSVSLSSDPAGHPFVLWNDNSSGRPDVYGLAETLDVNRVFYVNDSLTTDDTFTTAAGGNNAGTSPNAPANSIQSIIDNNVLGPGDVILVDSGSHTGFSVTSADNGFTIIGSNGVPSTITSSISFNDSNNITVRGLTTSGLTLTNTTNIQLNHVNAGTLTIIGGSGARVEQSTLTAITLAGATAGAMILHDVISGSSGVTISSASSVRVVENRVSGSSGVSITGVSSGIITGNDISASGTVFNLAAVFTGSIDHNRIHGGNVGVSYSAAALLNSNQIYANTTGIFATVNDTVGGLGFVAGSAGNDIYQNGTGVSLIGRMQNQHIYLNTTGVTGSGILGGNTYESANFIERNSTGISFAGTVQFNRIARNTTAIIVQTGQLVAHNIFDTNSGDQIETQGATDVRIINNTFYSTASANIHVDGVSSNVQVLNNILQTSGGFDLFVADDSRAGFFSDYNDLYSTETGRLVHWLVDFNDILDWQQDVHLFDMHSIGTTVVNPTWGDPRLADRAGGDFRILPIAAGLRSTSPASDSGVPYIDLALPGSYSNLLVNPTFASGVTGWTVDVGGTTQASNPSSFDGSAYFYAGAVSSGFAEQIVSLTAAGYSTSDLDGNGLSLIFGGRVRSANESPADLGQIIVTFLDGSNANIGASTTITATNVNDRWELLGSRIDVPVGARSVKYRFQSTRQSGSGNDAYLDGAFASIQSRGVGMDLGVTGNVTGTEHATEPARLSLRSPDLYQDFVLNSPLTIRWDSYGNVSGSSVKIDLLQDTASGPMPIANIASAAPDTGSFAWTPSNSGLAAGTRGLRIQISLVNNPAVMDRSTEPSTVPEAGNNYYLDDSSNTGDQYTPTTIGSNRNTGKTPTQPKPLPTTLLRIYDLGPGDIVYADAGTYNDFTNIVISGASGIGDDEGLTFQGPTTSSVALLNALGFSTGAIIELNQADFTNLFNLTLGGGLQYGLWLHATSTNNTLNSIIQSGASVDGIRIESDSSNVALDRLTAHDNGHGGILVFANINGLSNSSAYNNPNDYGFYFASAASGAIFENLDSHNNKSGVYINGAGASPAVFGNANLALSRGNKMSGNLFNGIITSGNVTVAGNEVSGATSGTGISASDTTLVINNVVFGNGIGINNGTIQNNRVYNNSSTGIVTGLKGQSVTENVVYSNGTGIFSQIASNAAGNSGPVIVNNLIYANSFYGINLQSGINADIRNNTVVQYTGSDFRHTLESFGSAAVNVRLRNNIFVVSGGGFVFNVDTSVQSALVSDYNLFLIGSGCNLGNFGGVNQATLTGWRSASLLDQSSLSGDPGFVSQAGADGQIGFVSGTDYGSDDNFHEISATGSYKGGSLAPVVSNVTGLPVTQAGSFSADVGGLYGPGIDRGDASFAYSNEPSPNGAFINIGAFGNTAQASESPSQYLVIIKPEAGANALTHQSLTITWRQENIGSGTVTIDLIHNATGLTEANVVTGASNNGTYVWSIPDSIPAGTDYQIRITRVGGSLTTTSGVFSVAIGQRDYYVNDNAFAPGDLATAVGSDANDGLTPATPKATIQALLAAYDFGPGDIIHVDRGQYDLTTNIQIDNQDSGVTIRGFSGLSNTDQWAAKVLSDGPTHYYRLGELSGTSVADSSGNGRTGTYLNGVTLGSSGALDRDSNSAITFDGVNDYVQLPSGFASFPNGFSFETWIFPTAANSYARIFDLGNGQQNDNIVFSRQGTTGNLYFGIVKGTAEGGAVIASNVLTLNQWQHIAVSMDSAGNVKIYRNGVLVASGSVQVPNNVTRTSNFLGHSNWSSDAYYAGKMDEPAFYDKVLADAQIASRFDLIRTTSTINRGSTTSGNDLFRLNNADNITLDTLTLTSGGAAIIGLYGADSDGLTVINSSISGAGTGIYLDSSNDSATIVNNSISGNTTGLYLRGASANVSANQIFSNNTGVDIGGATSSLSGNAIYSNSGKGIVSFQSGGGATPKLLVTFNTVRNNGGNGIEASNGWVQISSNIVYANNGTGIASFNGANIISGNTIYQNGGDGVFADSTGIVSGNRTYGNSGAGLSLRDNASASGNFVYSNVGGVYSGPNSSGGASSARIFNNLIYSNTAYAVSFVRSFSYSGDPQFYNNTVYQTANDAVRVTSGTGGTISIKNNIFYVSGINVFNLNSDSQAGYSSDYNDIFLGGSAIYGKVDSTNYATQSAWYLAYNYEQNSIIADPQFVDPDGADNVLGFVGGVDHGQDDNFSVLTTSPTIDNGDPALTFAAEPSPNGGRINLGHTGNTTQAQLSAAQVVQVLTPNGFERWIAGETHTISVRAFGYAGTVDLDYSVDGGATWTVITANVPIVAGSASFSWVVPNEDSNVALVRARPSGQLNPADTSNNPFGIVGGGNNYFINDGSLSGDVFTTSIGSDANSGKSPAHPMRTLSALLAAYDLGPADTIYVDTGTYSSTTEISLAGDDTGVTIVGPSGAGSPSAVFLRNNSNGPVIHFVGASNVTLQRLGISGGAPAIWALNSNSNNLSFINDEIYGSSTWGILLQGVGTENTLIQNCIIRNNGYRSIEIQPGSPIHVTIFGNEIRNNSGASIRVGASSITGNDFHDNTGEIVFTSYDGSTVNVASNQFHNNAYGGAILQGTANVEFIGNSVFANAGAGIFAQGALVTGNVVYANGSDGITTAYSGSPPVVSGNRVFGNGGTGVYLGGNGVAHGNIIYSNVRGMILAASDRSPQAYNNVIYANTQYAADINSGDTRASAVLFDNNTIYQPVGYGISFSSGGIVSIRNNIVVVGGTYAFVYAGGNQASLVSDYNDVQLLNSAKFGQFNGSAYSTRPEWLADSNFDKHTLTSDPQFVDVDGVDNVLGYTAGVDHGLDDNFAITDSSPAIDRGDPSMSFVFEPLPNGGRVNIGAAGNTSAANPSPSALVQMLSPFGLERFVVGQTISINWRSNGIVPAGNVRLELLDSTGNVARTISSSIANTGSTNWTIPTDLIDGDYRVRVTALGGSQPTDSSYSTFQVANNGHDFYVNDNSTTNDYFTTAVGNNLNSGKLPSSPMATIQAILNAYDLGSSDVIHVDSGTWLLTANILIATDDSGVRIEGPQGGTGVAMIDRQAYTFDSSVGAFQLGAGTNDVTIDKFTIVRGAFGIFASDNVDSNRITVSHCDISGQYIDAIYAGHLNDQWTLSSNTVHDEVKVFLGSVGDGIAVIDNDGNTIINNTVYNCGGHAIYAGDQDSNTIIQGNLVYGSGIGITLDGGNGFNRTKGGQVLNNVVRNNTTGIYIGTGYSVPTGSGNEIYSNGTGLVVDYGATVSGNRVYINSTTGIVANDGSIVQKNVVFSNPTGIQLGRDRSFTGSVLSNLVYANANRPITITSSGGAKIWNNTLYSVAGDALHFDGATNASVFNNIIWISAGTAIYVASGAQTGFTSNRNIVFRTGSANFGFWNNASRTNLSDWQSASSLDANSTQGDPLFVDIDGIDNVLGYNTGTSTDGSRDDNFNLARLSPAIDHGDTTNFATTDINGAARFDDPDTTNAPGIVDAGAFEFLGNSNDSVGPTILSLQSPPPLLTTPVLALDVTFSESISAITLGTSSVTLTRNGSAQSVSGLSIALVAGNTYRISGLSGLTGIDGAYVLSVSAVGVRDLAGNSGTGTTSVSWSHVNNLAPTVVNPANASANPVIGTTVNLSALGTDDNGEANLTYTWSLVGSAPAAVTYSANGTNAAKTTTASFTRNGSYVFRVTISDTGGLAVSSDVSVNVTFGFVGIATSVGGAYYIDAIGGHFDVHITSGTVTFNSDIGAGRTVSIYVQGGTTAILNARQTLDTLSLSAGATASITGGSTTLLELNNLVIAQTTGASTATLDIGNAAVLLHSTDASDITRNAFWNKVVSGMNSFDMNGQANWNGMGIVSSPARSRNLTLGVDVFAVGLISNHDLIAVNGGPGLEYGPTNPYLNSVTNVGTHDILFRLTYAGDANLDGQITIDDYNNIDGAFLGLVPSFGWVSGDYDFNGSITIDDYNAIDTGFLYQTGPLN